MMVEMSSRVDELSIFYKDNPSENNFTRLILEYRPIIRNNVQLFLRAKHRPMWIVDDLSSEIELKIFNTIDKYFDPIIGNFESWAFALTRQYVIGALKNEYKNDEILLFDKCSEIEDLAQSSCLCDAYLLDEIKENIKSLDELTRKCIKLVFFENKNYEEAGKIVNMCPSAVWKRCRKGLDKIKESLK